MPSAPRQLLITGAVGVVAIAALPLAASYVGLRWVLGYRGRGLALGVAVTGAAAVFSVLFALDVVRLWRDQARRGWPGRRPVDLREVVRDVMGARHRR
jgi:hypothetical protein